MFESQIQNSNLNWLLTAYMFGIVMIKILEIFRFTRLVFVTVSTLFQVLSFQVTKL